MGMHLHTVKPANMGLNNLLSADTILGGSGRRVSAQWPGLPDFPGLKQPEKSLQVAAASLSPLKTRLE